MQNRKKIFFLLLIAFCSAEAVFAKPASERTAPVKKDASSDQVSYAFGVVLGSQLKDEGMAFNYDDLAQGFKDGVEGTSSLTMGEAVNIAQSAYASAQMEKAEESRNKEEAFLAENKAKDGVQVTESGLQYRVITEGTGDHPAMTNTVLVNYQGTLIDGTVFDSSYERDEPSEIPLDGVIAGWAEGLQLMNVGSKYEFVIPSNLAYGGEGIGSVIPPYATLIFEVELLSIEENADPAE